MKRFLEDGDKTMQKTNTKKVSKADETVEVSEDELAQAGAKARLFNMQTKEVSLVPKGANGLPLVLMKNHKGSAMTKKKKTKKEEETPEETVDNTETSETPEGETSAEGSEEAPSTETEKAEGEDTGEGGGTAHETLLHEKIVAATASLEALKSMTGNLTEEAVENVYDMLWSLRSLLWGVEDDVEVLALMQKSVNKSDKGDKGAALIELSKALTKSADLKTSKMEEEKSEAFEKMCAVFEKMQEEYKTQTEMLKALSEKMDVEKAETPETPEVEETPEGEDSEEFDISPQAPESTKTKTAEKSEDFDPWAEIEFGNFRRK